MGSCGGFVLHLFFIFFLFLTSLYYAQNLISKSSFEDGVDEKGLISEKVRFLLDIGILKLHKSRNGGTSAYLSPFSSPSPSPGAAAAPTASKRAHSPQHALPPLHRHASASPPRKMQKQEPRKSMKRATVWTAVAASVGAASMLCAVGLFLCRRRFKKLKRKPRRGSRSKGKSKFTPSQSSGKKVTSDPERDLFYLDSLQSAFDLGKTHLRSLDENEESVKKVAKDSEYFDGRRSSRVEVVTVHEISESIECSSSCGERLISEEICKFDDKTVDEERAHSSEDDESFHSFGHSSSSHVRNSNASLGELSEISQDDEGKNSHFPRGVEDLRSNPFSASPPPPPPPPPPPRPYALVPSIKSDKKRLPSISYSKVVTTVPSPPLPSSLSKGSVTNHFRVPFPIPFQLEVPTGKDGSPLPKLKPLHWDKVRAASDRSTVWDKLRSSSFEFDEEMIESLFGYNLQNQMKNEDTKSKSPSPSKHVLDLKRLQNITILSKALNSTAEQVCNALICGVGLSLQDLEALSKMVPTKEEEAKLSSYKGDVLELGSAEKLVKAMLKIPFAFARIDAMLYRETFEDEVHHLIKSFSMLEEACKELRSSRLFLKLLEAVLKTGNRMNIGTIRGGARAFKLDALLKLADVKGTDGKTTLLHFVVQEIMRSEGLRVSESIMGKINMRSKNTKTEDKEENYREMGLDLVSGLCTELCNVKKTATIDLDVLASSVTNLSDSLNRLKHLVQKDMAGEEAKGNFVNSMRSFLTYAEVRVKELQGDENRVLCHVKEITEYFHGNMSKDESNPLRIFVIVRDFLSMLDQVCKELRSFKTPRSFPAPF